MTQETSHARGAVAVKCGDGEARWWFPPDMEWVQTIAKKHRCDLLPGATPEHDR